MDTFFTPFFSKDAWGGLSILVLYACTNYHPIIVIHLGCNAPRLPISGLTVVFLFTLVVYNYGYLYDRMFFSEALTLFQAFNCLAA